MRKIVFNQTVRIWIAVYMVMFACGQLRADDVTAVSSDYAWTGNTIDNLAGDGTDVYLYNVATGYYMNQGGFWGTQPALRKVGIPVQVYSSITETVSNGTYTASDGCYFLKSGMSNSETDNSSYNSSKTEGYIGYVEQTDDSETTYPGYFDWGRLYMDRTPVSTSYYAGSCDIGFSQVTDVTTSTVYQVTVTPDDKVTYYWTAVADSGSLYIDLVTEDKLEAKGDSAYWILVTLDDLKGAFDNTNGSAASPADATFMIKDQNFHRNNDDISEWKCSTDGGSTTTTLSATMGETFYYGMGHLESESLETTTTDDDGNETTTTWKYFWSRLYGQYFAANIYNAATATVTQDISIDRSGWYRVGCTGFYVEPDSSSDDEEPEEEEEEEQTTSNVLYVLGATGGSWSWDSYSTLAETSTSGVYYGELKVAAGAYVAFYDNITDQTMVSNDANTDNDSFYTAYRYGTTSEYASSGDCDVANYLNTAITLVNCSTTNTKKSFYFSTAATYYVTVDMSSTGAMTVTFSTTASTATAKATAADDADVVSSTDGTMTAVLFAKSSDTSAANSSSSISLYHMGANDGDELSASDINTQNGYLQGGRLITNSTTQDTYENYIYVYVDVADNSTATLTIGVEVTNGSGGWTCFDDVELAYMGNSTEYIVLDETDEALTYAPTDNGTTTYTSYGLNDQLGNAISYGSQEGNSMKNYTLALAREMQDGKWNSLCLPVDLTYSQLQAAFGTEVVVAKLTGVQVYDSSNQIIEFTTIGSSDSLKHDSLYIIKPVASTLTTRSDGTTLQTPLPNSGETGYTRSISRDYYVIPQVSFPQDIVTATTYDKEISQAAIDAMSDDGGSITFYGTYIKQTSRVPYGSYMIGRPSNGSDDDWGFYHYTGSTALTVKGFRTWIQSNVSASSTNNVAASNLIFTVDGLNDPTLNIDLQDEMSTGLGRVSREPSADAGRSPVYSLSGQLVRQGSSLDGLAKGIYIVNGKKYIVK